MYNLYLAKVKERGRPFFERDREGWCKVRLPQIAFSFFKRLRKFLLLWNLSNFPPLPLLCCFLETHTTKYIVDNFFWIEFLPLVTKGKNCGLRGKMFGAWYCHTLLYLILLTLCFHEMFKLIFLKLSSWPKTMYAEHWRKMGNFPILLVQSFRGALVNSCIFEYVTVLPIKNKFSSVILTFYFELVPPFYFLKWNRFFSTFMPVRSESCHYFNYLFIMGSVH